MSSGRTIAVLGAGLLTTIQDRGRWGYQSLGVPVAGPMDVTSHDAANALVGNDAAAATLEVTIAGPQLRLDVPVRLAIAGADLTPTVDGEALEMYCASEVSAGALLAFGARRRGARAYVAFEGGIESPLILGSRATHPGSGFGRAVKPGDVLPLGAVHNRPGMTPGRVALPQGGARVRVRRGPHGDDVPDAAWATLAASRFTVAPQSNRMGYRLTGPAIPLGPRPPMISDATFSGAIQVTPSGEAILLMADRQTTGGYPQVAVVVADDLPIAGQLAPGDWIEFEAAP